MNRQRVCGVLAMMLVALGLLVAPVRAEVAGRPAPGARSAYAVTGVRVFGYSVKGRALRAYRIGDPTSTTKVVVLATMHGDEAGPARVLLNLVRGAPVRGADIWLVPYLNRDGMARHTRKNARGVDLNRNFPVGWVRRTGTYNSGRRPASEPETRALMRFLGNVRPGYVISFHQPLYGVDTSYGKTRALGLRLARGLELPRKLFNCNSGCHGTMTQWFNRKFPGAALTVEYGYRMSTRQVTRTGPQGILDSVFATREPLPPSSP